MPSSPSTTRAAAAAPEQVRRVAFYSHDTQGLGHTRRNIALAAALVAAHPETDVLLITGNPEASMLPLPPRTDVLTLPAIRKTAAGEYATRSMGSPLELVIDLRARIIDASLGAFSPDLLVVDKVAAGVQGELLPALATLRTQGGTRVVLGLREVLDRPDVAVREWAAAGTDALIEEHYDAVWVYGDPDVYDPVAEYGLPAAVADRVSYTGYLGHGRTEGLRPRTRPAAGVRPPAGPYVLCTVGGGQDGEDLAVAFASAPLPAGHRGVLLTGPFMRPAARARVAAAAELDDRLEVHEFVADCDEFIAGAAAVVSMAGYNSVCEVLAAGCPTLLVPRVRPREEQLLRAARLAERDLVDWCHPDQLSSAALGAWLGAAVQGPRPAGAPIDLDGLRRVPQLVETLLGRTVPAAPAPLVSGWVIAMPAAHVAAPAAELAGAGRAA